VRRDSGMFSNASFFSGHSSAADSTMHSFTNPPSENGLLFWAILWAMMDVRQSHAFHVHSWRAWLSALWE
jgi:hypothetical protein